MGIFRNNKRHVQASVGGLIRGGNPATPDAILKRQEEWQKRVLAYADSVPEVSAAAAFFHSTLERVVFEVEGIDPVNKGVLDRQLRSVPSGRMGENLFLVGEIVAAYEYSPEERATIWHSYGCGDYQYKKGKPLKVRGDDDKFHELDARKKAFRVWRPSRTTWTDAWSPHKALLDLLEAMYVHQLADAAVATSRLAGAGILYIPNDELLSIPMTDSGEPEPGTQEELRYLISQAMLQSVKDRSAVDAVVPLVLFGAAEHADGLRHVLMERKDDAEAFAARMQAYRERYATGVDLPPEIVTGLGNANHWSAWKVDQNTWTYYIAPMAQLIADALLKDFVIPVAQNLGANTADIKVVPNGSHVVAKPDRTDAAIRLRQLGVLSRVATALAAGFTEEDLEPVEFAPIRKQLEELPAQFRDSGNAVYASLDVDSQE